jgi:hypothetical protein
MPFKKIVYSLALLPLLMAGLAGRAGAAAAAHLYLSSPAGSVAPGGILTVEIHEDSGSSAITPAIQINLTYPADVLDFIGVDSSSAFAPFFKDTGGAGTVQMVRGSFSPVTGNQLVATVRFQAKTTSGSSQISFASGSEVEDKGTNITGTMTGGNYTIAAPAPVPAPQPAPVQAAAKAPNTSPAPVKAATPSVQSLRHDLSAGPKVQPVIAGASVPSRWPLVIPAALAVALPVYHRPRR